MFCMVSTNQLLEVEPYFYSPVAGHKFPSLPSRVEPYQRTGLEHSPIALGNLKQLKEQRMFQCFGAAVLTRRALDYVSAWRTGTF